MCLCRHDHRVSIQRKKNKTAMWGLGNNIADRSSVVVDNELAVHLHAPRNDQCIKCCCSANTSYLGVFFWDRTGRAWSCRDHAEHETETIFTTCRPCRGYWSLALSLPTWTCMFCIFWHRHAQDQVKMSFSFHSSHPNITSPHTGIKWYRQPVGVGRGFHTRLSGERKPFD